MSAAPSVKGMSARRADYVAPKPRSEGRRPAPAGLSIQPCASLEPLAEVRGALRKLKHDKGFMSKIFEARDKQLFPRDILVATVPTKKGGERPIGLIRRSFCFNKAENSRELYIDFVWVMPEFRGCGVARGLLSQGVLVGRPKDVHLQVAGSEANTAAVGLYKSFGFVWDEHAPDKTEMILSADLAATAAAAAPSQHRVPRMPARVAADLQLSACGRVALVLRLEASLGAREMPKKRHSASQQDRAVRLSAG